MAFCSSHGANDGKAHNLLSWLDIAGYAYRERGVFALTDAGRAWLGSYEIEEEHPTSGVHRIERPQISRLVLDLTDPSLLPPGCLLRPRRVVGSDKHGGVMWECGCACNPSVTVTVSSRHIRNGRTRSCGCVRRGMGRTVRLEAFAVPVAKKKAGQGTFFEYLERMVASKRRKRAA